MVISMKHLFISFLAAALAILLCGCGKTHISQLPQTTGAIQPSLSSTQEQTTPPPTTPAPTTTPQPTTTPVPTTTRPEHSPLYIPGLSVEDVILYFNEVCLDSEYIYNGNPSVIQKWAEPLYYTLEGKYTDQDLATLQSFTDWLNTLEGFPGIYLAEDRLQQSLRICFCTNQEMVDILGPNFSYMDGGVTFWYIDNEIYDATICYRQEIHQLTRNSVILEEIYNSLGPAQDTALRPDSIIYQHFSEPQWLSPVDELILQLLYHPDILPGMNAQECEQVIRSLYY